MGALLKSLCLVPGSRSVTLAYPDGYVWDMQEEGEELVTTNQSRNKGHKDAELLGRDWYVSSPLGRIYKPDKN